MDNLSGDSTRLEYLQAMVDESKKALRYWEGLVTHEVCLQAGQHYPVQNKVEE